MNILKLEFKRTFRSWLYFTIGLVATFIIFAAFFDFFKGDAAVLDQLLKNFPPEFKAAFGFADVNLSELAGYLSFITSFIVLIGAVFGMKQGVSLLSEEVRVKAADFLLTKPVTRSQIATGKLLATLLGLALQNILLFACALAFVSTVIQDTVDTGILALLCFSIFFVQLFFVGVGSALAAILPRIKAVMPITLGVVFFFFIIEMINQSLLEKVLSYMTPFAYFKGSAIVGSHTYDLTYLAVDLAIFAVCTLISYLVYQRKDIHAI
jgi:ABC-2 type transport system permease protein